jgi:hypothetical protein
LELDKKVYLKENGLGLNLLDAAKLVLMREKALPVAKAAYEVNFSIIHF